MTFEEFFAEVARTSDPKASFEARLSCDGLGLCGEAREFVAALYLDASTVRASPGSPSTTYSAARAPAYVIEAGDVLWYVAHLYALLGCDGAGLAQGALYNASRRGPWFVQDDALALLLETGAVADMVKKIAHHGRYVPEFRQELLVACERVTALVRSLLADRGATLAEALDANVQKLRARFPAGQWNADDAAAKRDEG